MLNALYAVTIRSFIMLSGIMLNVIVLNVVHHWLCGIKIYKLGVSGIKAFMVFLVYFIVQLTNVLSF